MLRGSICSFEQVRRKGAGEVARLAWLQHKVLHRQQLLAAGVGRGAIAHRLRTGRLHSLHCDVYLVGSERQEPFSRAMAAALHLRGDGVLSHLIAAAIWGVVDDIPDQIDVTLVGRNANRQPGVTIHRVATLDSAEVRWRHGLPVTSPARTILDLAAILPLIELEAALAEARHRKLVNDRQLEKAVARAPRHAGVARLRRLLESDQVSRTRSHYERRLLQMIRAAGLPSPVTNVKVEGHLVDMVWHDRRLIVEFDGFKFHGDRRAFETDRRRDQDLVAAGYRVIRITARQIENEPLAVLARLAAALAR